MLVKLIVADSSPSVQKAVQMAFPDSEFEIHPFKDGLELMKAIDSLNPDAVLLSLYLPGKDGYDVGLYLKSQEKFRQTCLILLKGTFETVDRERIAGVDYDEIIDKPFDSEGLVSTVRNLVERKSPQSLPEAPPLEDVHDSEQAASSLSAESQAWVEEKVRKMLREEILGVQRELEKRVKAKIIAELRDWIRKEIFKDESPPE